MCVMKRKNKFENCKIFLESTQLENKISYLEKNKINIDSLKKNHKQFIGNNKSILKTQQRYRSDSIKTFAHGTSKDLVSQKEGVKCSNVIKQYKKLLTLMML